MQYCENTRKHKGKYQHQCPHCKKWNDFGAYGVAQNSVYALTYTGCCKKYKIHRGTVNSI